MSSRDLRRLLNTLGEPAAPAAARHPLQQVWRDAADRAHDAYVDYKRSRTRETYSVWLACADQADAAHQALARHAAA
jgi:hypothetical protein